MNKATFLFALLVAASAQAQTVSGVSGTLSHGQTVTISGSGFGANAPSVQEFDGMEGGSFSVAWTGTGDLAVANISRHANSAKGAYANINPTLWPNTCGANVRIGPDSPQWFASFWLYYGANYTYGIAATHSQKIFRLWTTGANNENVWAGLPGGIDGGVWWNNFTVAVQGIDINWTQHYYEVNTAKDIMDIQNWHHLQTEFIDSDLGAFNGAWRLWVDGKLIAEETGICTREDFSAYKSVSRLGIEYENVDAQGEVNDDNDVYFDDFYATNSIARVELCDSASYGADFQHREVQQWTSWSDGSVLVTLNTGSFPEGANLYLYVTDATGTQSNAYPITLSGGGGSVTPPLNLSVSGGN